MRGVVLTVVLGASLLSACGSKTDANEQNFSAAIQKYLEVKGDLCLQSNKWPVELSVSDMRMQKTLPGGIADQMAALESVGLVTGAELEVEGDGMFSSKGMKYKVKRYSLTDAAKPFVKEKEETSIGLSGKTQVQRTYLCWGKLGLDKVVKWEGPRKDGDYQEASVKYLYKVDGLADWAKNAAVQKAFSSIGGVINAAGKEQKSHAVKLTSVGWEAKGLD